jgi:hypothetical protein
VSHMPEVTVFSLSLSLSLSAQGSVRPEVSLTVCFCDGAAVKHLVLACDPFRCCAQFCSVVTL